MLQNSVEGSARSGRSSSKEDDEKMVDKSKEQTGLRDFFGQYRRPGQRPGQAGPAGPPRGQPRHGDHAGGNRRSRSPRTRAPRRTEAMCRVKLFVGPKIKKGGVEMRTERFIKIHQNSS